MSVSQGRRSNFWSSPGAYVPLLLYASALLTILVYYLVIVGSPSEASQRVPPVRWDLSPALHDKALPESESKSILFPCGVHRRVASLPAYLPWWDKLLQWEPETFELFSTWLDPSMTYLGFGEWIAPTGLFAATIARRVYLLEPDPIAFAALKANVLSNPDTLGKTHCSQICIAPTTSTLRLTGVGASGSFLLNAEAKAHNAFMNTKERPEWDVDCLRLETYIKEHRMDTTKLFVKVDTESAEWLLAPSWMGYFKSLPRPLPVMHLSIHDIPKSLDEKEALKAFLAFIKLYKYVWFHIGYEAHANPIATETLTAADAQKNIKAARYDAIVLSDYLTEGKKCPS